MYILITTLQYVLKEAHEPAYSKSELSFFIIKGHALTFHLNVSYSNIT
jgi:hypothetical protein